MIGKILVAVDGSENNHGAVDAALDLAKGLGAELTAVHVTPQADAQPNAFGGDTGAKQRAEIVGKESDEAFRYVNKASEAAGVQCKCLLLAGNPGTEIVNVSGDYDLVVCGTLGRAGLAKAIIGSVSSEIAKHSKCAVMITRRCLEGRGDPALSHTMFYLSAIQSKVRYQ